MRLVNINKEAIIYFEDTIPDKVYLLKHGKIMLEKQTEYFLVVGDTKRNKLIHEGEFFGYEEYFSSSRYQSRAVAIEKSEVVYFDFEEFLNLIKSNNIIRERIVYSLIERIKLLNNKIKELSISGANEDENIVDIYSYFFNKGNLKIADDILSRVEKSGCNKEILKNKNEKVEKDVKLRIEEVENEIREIEKMIIKNK